MHNLPSAEIEPEIREAAPIRGLLIAVPIAAGLWFGIYELVRFLA